MGKLRRSSTLVAAALACALASPAHAGEDECAPAVAPALPILFGANQGQWDAAVLFPARVPGLVASLLADGLLLDADGAGLRLRFVGADAGARAEGRDPRPARVHFLGGAREARAVPTYGRVLLAGLH